MSVFDKIKNVLFTEEEETEEIPVISAPSTFKDEEEKEEQPRFKKVLFQEEAKIEERPLKIEREEEKVVEPLFKKEEEVKEVKQTRSPFQSFDEEEFDRIAAINKSRLLERDRKAREEKERQANRFLEKEPVIKKEDNEHKFKPSPVISPVYGILDKNYTKEDILPTASSEGTLPKVMDVDKVRQKAFGTLESIEQDINDDLEDIKITTFSEDKIDDSEKVLTNEGPVNLEDEIDSITPREERRKQKEMDELPIETTQDIREETEDEDEIDSDLFNLIDSMYQSEEGE